MTFAAMLGSSCGNGYVGLSEVEHSVVLVVRTPNIRIDYNTATNCTLNLLGVRKAPPGSCTAGGVLPRGGSHTDSQL